MTVAELRAALARFPGAWEVLHAGDDTNGWPACPVLDVTFEPQQYAGSIDNKVILK